MGGIPKPVAAACIRGEGLQGVGLRRLRGVCVCVYRSPSKRGSHLLELPGSQVCQSAGAGPEQNLPPLKNTNQHSPLRTQQSTQPHCRCLNESQTQEYMRQHKHASVNRETDSVKNLPYKTYINTGRQIKILGPMISYHIAHPQTRLTQLTFLSPLLLHFMAPPPTHTHT